MNYLRYTQHLDRSYRCQTSNVPWHINNQRGVALHDSDYKWYYWSHNNLLLIYQISFHYLFIYLIIYQTSTYYWFIELFRFVSDVCTISSGFVHYVLVTKYFNIYLYFKHCTFLAPFKYVPLYVYVMEVAK